MSIHYMSDFNRAEFRKWGSKNKSHKIRNLLLGATGVGLAGVGAAAYLNRRKMPPIPAPSPPPVANPQSAPAPAASRQASSAPDPRVPFTANRQPAPVREEPPPEPAKKPGLLASRKKKGERGTRQVRNSESKRADQASKKASSSTYDGPHRQAADAHSSAASRDERRGRNKKAAAHRAKEQGERGLSNSLSLGDKADDISTKTKRIQLGNGTSGYSPEDHSKLRATHSGVVESHEAALKKTKNPKLQKIHREKAEEHRSAVGWHTKGGKFRRPASAACFTLGDAYRHQENVHFASFRRHR